MLLILIPAFWLAIAVFVVTLCWMASRGDAALAQQSPQPGTPARSFPGLVLFEDHAEAIAQDERLARHERVGAASSRGRRADCVVS